MKVLISSRHVSSGAHITLRVEGRVVSLVGAEIG